MKPKTENKNKPLKKLKTLKKQNEEEQLLLKPAVRIQELKNKLIILAHELFQTKKINEALYWKMRMLTYARTTEVKLKSSYKALKSIDSEVKLAESTKTKIKKKTLKDFKSTKTDADTDKNILYLVYVKFKIWNVVTDKEARPGKNTDFLTLNDGSVVVTQWKINQVTIQVYGKKNIIDEIKDFIDVTMSEIYVQKIEILDVHVNREIYQPQQYRYLGAERNYNVKKDENYIKYYKAWNASFEYKGFNLDMNNDIAYECVPSALYNTYGIKKENSYDYLHSIHKGGLNYVKSCLNKNDKYDYSQIENKTINYVNPYDKEIKDSEKMIQDIINQYEYDIDYEFDINSVDDIKDDRVKNEIKSIYKSIELYKEQKKYYG